MSTYVILKLALTLHIVGLAVSAGTSLTFFLYVRKFWKLFSSDSVKATFILNSTKGLSIFVCTGIGVSVLSGALMMYMGYSALMFQLWFKIKLIAVILIIVNGIVGFLSARKVRKLITARNQLTTIENVSGMKTISQVSGVVQLLLFVVVFIMASFRFV